MAKRRRYTDEERASILAMLESEGYPDKKGALTAVSRYAKVPASTMVLWWQGKRNPVPSDLQNEKKVELADLFEQAARKYIEHGMKDTVMAEVPGKDAMTAAAIAADKMNLLRNKPTEHIEHSGTIGVDERRARIAELLERGRTRRASGATGSGEPDSHKLH